MLILQGPIQIVIKKCVGYQDSWYELEAYVITKDVYRSGPRFGWTGCLHLIFLSLGRLRARPSDIANGSDLEIYVHMSTALIYSIFTHISNSINVKICYRGIQKVISDNHC